MTNFKLGIDIGSTTIKVILIDDKNQILFSHYTRHNAKVKELLIQILTNVESEFGNFNCKFCLTGSIGLGIADVCHFPFIQEVVAASKTIQIFYPQTNTMVDIGGEDAKVVFYKNSHPKEFRMNGNCAGGTGAFIDQMAILLGVSLSEMNTMALQATELYPIASRCGVFCKTDIQNLIAKNISKENIAASIFHAVAVQTIVTLAHGCDITPKVLCCGGPFSYLPALQKAFQDYLNLNNQDFILPENGTLLSAWGCALHAKQNNQDTTLKQIIQTIEQEANKSNSLSHHLPPLFANEKEYTQWQNRINTNHLQTTPFQKGNQEVFLGIDSGSTTTKIVALNKQKELLFSYYVPNQGNPLQAVKQGFTQLLNLAQKHQTTLSIMGSCSTGYGEELIKAAFQLHHGLIETMAHYKAASYLDPEVSFILDIGGQDMKAIFVNQGIIERIEINEACSSGCGSFIETFAKSWNSSAAEFAQLACKATQPSDLGTRCTVFMNSKVKQELRTGASINNISAGLSYSVVKNCLYKVLNLTNCNILGRHIVVQGGTMRNDSIVRAFELECNLQVKRFQMPELMGAIGCALLAIEQPGEPLTLSNILQTAEFTQQKLYCRGCQNNCMVIKYKFQNGKHFYSGNKCERIFNNAGAHQHKGENSITLKSELLFNRNSKIEHPIATIGIPRCLNMYDEYPFWHTLLTECDLQVVLSDVSTYTAYETDVKKVMSDNICFPAKVVHSHITNLLSKKVDRIFMPFVIHAIGSYKAANTFHCPVVTGYSEVIKSIHTGNTPLDAPTMSFKQMDLLKIQCKNYLSTFNIEPNTINIAFNKAIQEYHIFEKQIKQHNIDLLQQAQEKNQLVIILGCRPYHIDPLIHHNITDMITSLNVTVITDDIIEYENIELSDTHYLAQWANSNRILRAAKWCASQPGNIQFVQLTSFGCGPDTLIIEEAKELLARAHKPYTVLKLDDINNIGSMRLRIRSLIESLRMSTNKNTRANIPFKTTPIFNQKYKNRKLLLPYFTPFLSPLIPALLAVEGYHAENLPLSDKASAEWGLKYSNNEICYPATLIVGDVIKAFKSGKEDPAKCAVAISQTGGQCRASNYLSLIKKALISAGYTDVPVISVNFSSGIANTQPAFSLNWVRMIPYTLRAVLYTDSISKFYHAAVVREKEKGQAGKLKEHYLKLAEQAIRAKKIKQLDNLLLKAATDFNQICRQQQYPKIGIVGEIFLKFNPYSHLFIEDWLIQQQYEIVPPMLLDFFTQAFVNRDTNVKEHLEQKSKAEPLYALAYALVNRHIKRTNQIAAHFKYFEPFTDIFKSAQNIENIITKSAQFGEGWLLPAEVVNLKKQGVNNILCLQPFGCIANHIVSKGVFSRIQEQFPDINILTLDFDSGVSDVNITNRILLFLEHIQQNQDTPILLPIT